METWGTQRDSDVGWTKDMGFDENRDTEVVESGGDKGARGEEVGTQTCGEKWTRRRERTDRRVRRGAIVEGMRNTSVERTERPAESEARGHKHFCSHHSREGK